MKPKQTFLVVAVPFVLGLALVAQLTIRHLRDASRSTISTSIDQSPDYLIDSQADFTEVSYEHVFNRAAPIGFAKWIDYATKHGCSTKPSDYRRIYFDLNYWVNGKTRGIPASAIDTEILQTNASRVKFIQGIGFDMSEEWRGWNVVEPLSAKFAEAGVPSFEFLVNNMDEPLSLPADDRETVLYDGPADIFRRNKCINSRYGPSSVSGSTKSVSELHGYFLEPVSFVTQSIGLPVFSQSKLECFRDLIVPLKEHKMTENGQTKDTISWEDKKKVLFWRGSTNDGHNAPNTRWKDFHRTRLVQWAKDFEELHPYRVFDAGLGFPESTHEWDFLVDVGFEKVVQCEEPVCTEIEAEYGLKSYVSFEYIQQFKYLLVVDGNGWPNRLQSYLETNSVILYNGIFWDWYMWKLQPMVHYVPVALDYSDLEEKVEWLMRNDEIAKKISQNARELMSKLNEASEMTCYSGLMMLEYANLYQKNL